MHGSPSLDDLSLERCHLRLQCPMHTAKHVCLHDVSVKGSTVRLISCPQPGGSFLSMLGDSATLLGCAVLMCWSDLSTWEFVYCLRVFFFPSKVSKYNHIKGLN